MTRKDQIIDKSLQVEQEMHDKDMCINWGLVQIAEWADETRTFPEEDAFVQMLLETNKYLQQHIADLKLQVYGMDLCYCTVGD